MEGKNKKYYPCSTCHDRFGKDYTEECDAYCDYAMAIKKLKEYEDIVDKFNSIPEVYPIRTEDLKKILDKSK